MPYVLSSGGRDHYISTSHMPLDLLLALSYLRHSPKGPIADDESGCF